MDRLKKTALACLLFLPLHWAYAVDPFTISDIRVEGIQKLEAGTVFNYLPLKVGDELNDEEARLSIRALFETGFFQDVALEQDGTVLVVKVVERPSIAEIVIEGNRKLDSEAIDEVLEAQGLVQGRIFNSTNLDRLVQDIKQTYLAMGRYSATVESTIKELGDNRVTVRLDIDEGRVARIKKINIIGAEAIPAKDLKKEMRLKDKRGFRLFTTRNQYSKQKLEADIETIRSYYLDRGYHAFRMTATNVEISPNKQNIFLSISLEEGDLFTFAESVLEGADPALVPELQKLNKLTPGRPFSRKAVNQTRNAIIDRYADDGYAFVEVRPVFKVDEAQHTVTTVFTIVPNQRVYVRRINITGNVHTRDEVIRRELRQFEGAWYSSIAIGRSKDRLQRLGFFESVLIETPEVPGTTDQVDMNVVVKERETGSVQFSLGYSDEDGALLGAGYQQRNLLGTGKDLQVEVDTSDAARKMVVSYTNPYHTVDGISRTLRLTNRRLDAEEANTAEYLLNSKTAGVIYKIPIAETNALNLGVSLEQIDLETTGETPPEIQRAIERQPDGENMILTFGISKDARDDFFFPTRGGTGRAFLEAAIPGSEFEYYKINLQGTYYVPFGESLTLKGSLGLGYGDSFGDQREAGLPFFKNYFAGGASSVRGYESRSLGPRDSGETPAALGGDKRVLTNLELLFPAFGETDSKDKRVGLFLDGGMVFGASETIDPGDFRYSAGLVFNWFSPIGPFAISYGFPLNDEPEDEKEELQISIGTVFR